MSELAELIARRDEVLAELQEIESLAAEGADRILEAVKVQRWYFFRNNKYILMDRDTGLLWEISDYFEDVEKLEENSKISGWAYNWGGVYDDYGDKHQFFSRSLITNTTYAQDVDPNNKIYSERERLQFTLDLFTRNYLWPKFNDYEITNLFGRLYVDKSRLSAELQQLNHQIAPLMAVRVLSSEFNYTDSPDLTELAAISREERATFPLIAENTARILMNALMKIEHFEAHRDFVVNAVKTLTDWTEDYRVFRTSRRTELQHSCGDDRIDPEVWEAWFSDWQALRLEVERKLQPLLERGLKSEIPDGLIPALEEYKAAIDRFFLEERKGIYQRYAFVPGGELSDKFETEAELYKRTSKFQADLQGVIFSCGKSEERIFILNWADSLLDIQIDEVLALAADNGLDKISADILDGVAQLKLRNYDAYLSDAKAYSEEQEQREKQYNSLVFRMRQDLAKKEAE